MQKKYTLLKRFHPIFHDVLPSGFAIYPQIKWHKNSSVAEDTLPLKSVFHFPKNHLTFRCKWHIIKEKRAYQ